jgi:hypothetical protein
MADCDWAAAFVNRVRNYHHGNVKQLHIESHVAESELSYETETFWSLKSSVFIFVAFKRDSIFLGAKVSCCHLHCIHMRQHLSGC